MTTKNHWDEIFAKGQTFSVISDEDLDTLLSRVIDPKTALDVACGTGDLVVRLAKRGLTVTGADLSSVALAKAADALKGTGFQIQLIEADFDASDFDKKIGGLYDIIFIRLAFAFVKDPDTFLEMAKKLMAPGGIFICILPALLPWGRYDSRQLHISLPKEQLSQILTRHFSSVELALERATDKPGWPILTFVCRMQ